MSTELERLESGPNSCETPGGMGTVRFIAKCKGDAREMLATCKNVLKVALQMSENRCSDEEVWSATLPHRFVNASPPFPSPEELEAYHRLSLAERVEIDKVSGWPVRAFMNSFLISDRYWSWWDAVVLDENHIAVAVEVSEWPFPWESLRWLFRGSGAIDLQEEPL